MPPISRPFFDDDDAHPDAAAAGEDAPDDAADAEAAADDDEPDGALDDDDEDFPLGDGTADGVATVWCPYCGEPSEVAVDPGGGDVQEYVEDCPVCCRPWRVTVTYDVDGTAAVWARTDDE